jgi:hypothetical protein
MADYDKVLVRIIRDANNDPAKMREIVYEVARLALRRQANLQTPALSYSEMRHQLAKLEEAITRVEATASAEPGEAARVTNGDGSPMSCERDDAAFPLEEVRPHVPSKRAPVGSRELVLVPDRVNRSTYLVNPADFVSPDIPYRLASAPRPRAHICLYPCSERLSSLRSQASHLQDFTWPCGDPTTLFNQARKGHQSPDSRHPH